MEKAQDRLDVLEKIEKYELEGKFDIDPEIDPPAKELLPEQVDYLNKKLSSKIKTFFANKMGDKFFNNMLKNKDVIIKEVKGIENFTKVKGGAILTCNHFNPFDNYAVFTAIRPYLNGRMLYKVIREGNYTNGPKPYVFFFRHCNTLPLSSNVDTMKKFMTAVGTLLNRGEKILIYPEQAMWWNYKKPRPCKKGAYRLAVNNNVPVIPFFITMEDSDIIGKDGFPVQEYTINIMEAIYADSSLTKSENMENMKNENYKKCVKVYEDFYKIPLTYEKK